MKNSKNGIVLVTTIGLILLLSLLILKNIDISQKYIQKSNLSSLNTQLNRAFVDILEIIKNNQDEIKDAFTFSSFVNTPYFIGSDDEAYSITVDISSSSGTININNILSSSNQTNKTIYDFLYMVLSEYRVKDPALFLAIVLDTLDKDKEARVYGSEIFFEDSRFDIGSNITKQSFNLLLEYYVKKSYDANIYKIPWDEFVGFYGEKIDFNYIKEPFLNILQREYNLPTLEENEILDSYDKLNLSEDTKKEFEKIGIGFFVPTIFCEIVVFYQNNKKSLKFLYDTKTKKVGYVENIF